MSGKEISVIQIEGTSTPAGLRRLAGSVLADAGIPHSSQEIMWLLEEASSMDRTALVAYADRSLPEEVARRFAGYINRRLQREPVQYIVGYTDFFGLRISVSPDVLIPRPETEDLVALCLVNLDSVLQPLVVDVGTGSGCIALAVKSKRADAHVIGIDQSEAALKVAEYNSDELDLAVQWMHGDLFDASMCSTNKGEIDLMISNPPYVPHSERVQLEPEVIDHEPESALFPDGDPLEIYRALCARGVGLLKDNGCLIVEIHTRAHQDVAEVFRIAGYTSVSVESDLAGRERFVTGRMRGKKEVRQETRHGTRS